MMEEPCDNGEKVRGAFVLDCCDREIMSWVATTIGIDAALALDLMLNWSIRCWIRPSKQ